MAVAVKNTPDATSHRLLDHLAVDSLLGVAYVLASLWAVFYGLHLLWSTIFGPPGSFVAWGLLILAMVLVGGGLGWLGLRLVGAAPKRGLRAGIVLGLVGVLIIAYITSGIGSLIEQRLGLSEPAAGIGITLAVGVALLVGMGLLFARPGFERLLGSIEDQGWFTAVPYKRSQGQRVRRGTIVGILALAACGIYTMLNHWAGSAAPSDWSLAVPFTGGRSIVLLKDIQFTLPILVALASLWLAYRVVNLPVFADFLIATEAEMNKVSWTTRQRLIQDTIVVLVTVVLLTAFLFVVDVAWNMVLTRIGIIVEPKAGQAANTSVHW